MTKIYQVLLCLSLMCLAYSCNKRERMEKDPIKNKYFEALKKFNWQSDFEKVYSLLKPAIKVNQSNIFDNDIGISKFGGTPDLPEGINWPEFEGKPMIFLAQINFDETKDYDVEGILPKSGILYFFIHFNSPENEFGTEYQFIFNKNEYKVIYAENQNLRNTKYPENLIADYHFKPSKMEFERFYTFPDSDALEMNTLHPEDENNSYPFNERYGNFEGEQVLGYTMPIQGDVTWDWAFSYLNFKTFELTDEDKNKIDSLRPEFINLLQFSLENSYTGFERIGISIGYFGITKKDLKNKNFQNVVLIFQDT